MFESLLKHSSDLICITDKDARIISVNENFSNALKMKEKELVGLDIKELLHNDDLNKVQDCYSKLIDCGEEQAILTRLKTQDNSFLHVYWNFKYDPDQDFIFKLGKDLTKSELAKSYLDQIYSSLYQNAIIVITDSAGVIIDVNSKFCEISEYTKEELVGKTHRVVNSGAHPKEFFKEMWATISSGKVWTGVIENKKKSGKSYYVHSILCPLTDSNGKISEYLAIRFDLTKSYELEEDHRKILGILNETNAIAKVGGWEMDVVTQELTWTDETFRILEVEKRADRKPVLPEGIALFTDENIPIIEKAVGDCATEGIPYSLELEAKTAKGNVRWVYTNGKANYKEGKIVSISGTIQDIHDKKVNEFKLAEERQKNIQFSKLASLGEMSAGVAHEINNPLTIILGSLELLTKYKDDDEKFSKKVQTIEKSVHRIAKIVKNLKKFSRTSDSDNKKVLSARAIINECNELIELKSKRHQIDIKLVSENDFQFYGNEIEVEQVIINLLTNAVDAIKELDERWIHIEITSSGQIIVTDSGAGIDEKVLLKLFEPFYTTKAIGEGTGLGLSISKAIVEDHAGTLSYDSTQKNTTFIITLPVAK